MPPPLPLRQFRWPFFRLPTLFDDSYQHFSALLPPFLCILVQRGFDEWLLELYYRFLLVH